MTNQSSIISLRRKLEKEAWEIKSLSEIATEIISGNGVTKAQLGTGNYPAIKCGDINSKFKQQFTECVGFVNQDLLRGAKYCEFGDVLIGTLGSEDSIGKATVYLGNDRPIVGSDIKLIKHNQNGKFLSYILNTEFVKSQIKELVCGTTVTHLNKSCFQHIKVPVPPRHIQDQIVEYLDKWTDLESQLEQELEQELEQRKKQYEYYKESLLNSGMNKWEIISMDKIATEIMIGKEVSKIQLGTGNYPSVKCGDINSKFNISFDSCIGFVNPDLIKLKMFCEYGDVLVGSLSHTIDCIGKAAVYLGNEKPIVGKGVLLIKHKQNGKFLSYILSSEFVRERIKEESKVGPVVNLSKSSLQQVKIPIPSLEEQAQIVELLDKFHTITESFKDGLPSLIEKHRKQYIYYKEQILNPEVAA